MKIGFIGMGFVGGTTAKILSEIHEILPYDIAPEKGCASAKHLEDIARTAETTFICVPTPEKLSGEIDYAPIYNSVEQLHNATLSIKRNPKENLIIVRSTAVSGTTDKLAEKYPFHFAFNPEFLREKHALEDMKNTNRIIIGAENNESMQKVVSIYKPLFPNVTYVLTDRKTAEMIKYMNNGMLGGQTSLANEYYQICQVLGIDYEVVKNAVLLDSRIGRNLDVPGPDGDFGFGGKCLHKDIAAVIYEARQHGYFTYLLQEVLRSNDKVRTNQNWLNIPGATSTGTELIK